MLKVVLDTNVVVSALVKPESLPELILNMVTGGVLSLCLTEEIFAEYQEVLARDKFQKLNQKLVKQLLTRLKKESLWLTPAASLKVIKDDPADNKFLECALAAKADFLITGNTRHFPFKAFHGTRIVSPREFIALIAHAIF